MLLSTVNVVPIAAEDRFCQTLRDECMAPLVVRGINLESDAVFPCQEGREIKVDNAATLKTLRTSDRLRPSQYPAPIARIRT